MYGRCAIGVPERIVNPPLPPTSWGGVEEGPPSSGKDRYRRREVLGSRRVHRERGAEVGGTSRHSR